MAFDLNALFGQAKDAASQGMSDILKVGGNAGLGYLEQQGIAILQADQAQHVQQAQAATTEVLNRPGPASGLSAYFQNVISSPVIKNYGTYILAGVAAVGIAAVVIFGRKK